MITEEKLEKIKELADAMYYAAQQLTTDASRLHKAMDEYHKFIINEYHKEESVSEDNTLRKASEEYLKVLSETPYNNTPITNAQTIVRELISFLDNPSKYNPNHIEETVSQDLEQAIDTYLATYFGGEKEKQDWPFLKKMAIHFANWQKEQMMAKAVDGDITFDYYGDGDKTYGCIAHDSFCLEDFGLKDMDKVKVIVIKKN